MATTKQDRKSKKEEKRQKSKSDEDHRLSKELEMSFPASDPPAASEPGSGITGAVPPNK